MTHWIAGVQPSDTVDYRWEKILNAIVSGRGMTYQAAAEHVIELPIYGGELPADELAAIRSTATALAAATALAERAAANVP